MFLFMATGAYYESGLYTVQSRARVGQSAKGRTIIFLEGGDEKFEKECLQSLKRQNKLFAQLQNNNSYQLCLQVVCF